MSREQTPRDSTTWGYTVDAKDLFGDVYKGRPLIGRDTRIQGGVYYGRYGGEAIVVDPEKYPEEFEKLYAQVLERSREVTTTGRFRKKHVKGEVMKDLILGSVFDVTRESVRYSNEGVSSILNQIAAQEGTRKFQDGTKLRLNEFMIDGVGVCRHQALVAGTLLEMLKDRGVVRGTASVDRNEQWHPDGDVSGHAWVRYTNNAGEVYILDPAQGFIGTLEDSQKRESGRNYLRPGETVQGLPRELGSTAVLEVQNL